MSNLPHCQYTHMQLRHALRATQPQGGERLVGWGPASLKPGASSFFKQIGFALIPIVGDLLAFLSDDRDWLWLVLTDRRLAIFAAASPAVGPHPEQGPASIPLGALDIDKLDEPGAFRIACQEPTDAASAVDLRLKVEEHAKASPAVAKLIQGLRLLAEADGNDPDTDHDHPDRWEPGPSRWT